MNEEENPTNFLPINRCSIAGNYRLLRKCSTLCVIIWSTAPTKEIYGEKTAMGWLGWEWPKPCFHLRWSATSWMNEIEFVNLICRSAITIFPQRTDGKHDFRIWNPQVTSFWTFDLFSSGFKCLFSFLADILCRLPESRWNVPRRSNERGNYWCKKCCVIKWFLNLLFIWLWFRSASN